MVVILQGGGKLNLYIYLPNTGALSHFIKIEISGLFVNCKDFKITVDINQYHASFFNRYVIFFIFEI